MRAFAGDSRLSVTHSLPDPGHLIGSGIVKCLLMTHSGRSDLAWPIPPANLLSSLVPDLTNPASNWHLRFSPIEAPHSPIFSVLVSRISGCLSGGRFDP